MGGAIRQGDLAVFSGARQFSRFMNIVDLRQTTVRQIEPLLDEEAVHWRDELHWDYRGALELIKRFLEAHALSGCVAYENGTAANKWYSKIETKEYQVSLPMPEDPIVRGVQPFQIKEEYYFNMRFREKDRRLTPILTFGSDKSDLTSVVAWAVERTEGGRGFGYTGGHFHKNWENDNVRRMILNALLWTAKVDVPKEGVISSPDSGN
jgi:hypothetical protein